MPYGPIIAGATIQAGTLMIQAGMKRIIPEVAKLIDEPELEKVLLDLRLGKVISKALVDLTKQKSLR